MVLKLKESGLLSGRRSPEDMHLWGARTSAGVASAARDITPQRIKSPGTKAEQAVLQRSPSRGAPFGESSWQEKTAKRLDLQGDVRRPSHATIRLPTSLSPHIPLAGRGTVPYNLPGRGISLPDGKT